MEGGDARQFDEIIRMAQRAESAGLDSVWVGDSLTAKPRLEPLTALTAIAARTQRVRLGTAVLLAALRHPVLLAHQAATLDYISGGRLILGAGVGGAFNDAQRQEWRAAGVDRRRRASRFEEVIECMRKLTAGERVSFHGQHFELDDVGIAPKSPQAGGVGVLVAAHWRSGRQEQFQRVSRLGTGLISISDYPDEYAKLVQRVEHYAHSGGDRPPLEKSFYMTVNMDSDREAAAEEADRFLKLYYGMNFWGDRWGPYGPEADTVARIRAYRDAGAETIIIRFASFDQESQLERFLDSVAPRF